MLRGVSFAIVVMSVVASAVGAQQAEFQRIGLHEGLPQVSVRAVIQDRTGYLWIGTQGGLVRYDSYALRTFRHHPDDPATLRDNAVWALERDGNGGLWVGTDRGLDRFDPRSERFDVVRRDPAAGPAWAGRPIRALLRDSEGRLWIGTQDGLLVELPDGGELRDARVFCHDPDDVSSLPPGGVLAIAEDRQGRIWIGTDAGGVALLEPAAGGRFRRPGSNGTDRSVLAGSHVEALFEDSFGTLWIGTDSGLCRARLEQGGAAGFDCVQHDPADSDSLSSGAVSALAEDAHGALWVGTRGGGLNRLDSAHGRNVFVRHQLDQGDPRSLSDDDVRTLFVDRQGILWAGTWGGGLNRHDPTTEVFTVLRHRARDAQSLSHSTVLSILEDRSGEIWVGTWGGGLNRLVSDPSQLGAARFESWRHHPEDPRSLASDSPWPLIQDQAGDLWIGTWGGGLDRLPAARLTLGEPHFEHQRHRPDDPTSLGSDRIAALLEDSAGRIWVGTWGGGLQRVLLDGEREVLGFATCRHAADDPGSIPDDFVKALTEDSQGNLWIGMWTGGVARLPAAEAGLGRPVFVSFRPDPSDSAAGPSHEHVLCIHEDRRGRIWIGTYGGGLNLLDPGSGRFRFVMAGDVPGSEAVYGILEDASGNLWLSTNGGLVRFDPDTESVLHWDHGDGLAGDEFDQGAFMRSADGRLWFGGVEGLTVFDPAQAVVREPPPPMALTDFLLFNESVAVGGPSVLSAAAGWSDTIVLGPEDDVLAFEFAVLDFRASHRVRYEYHLDGFDRTWIPVSTGLRRAGYTRVPPGDYVFRARASVEGGRWADREVSVRLTIEPPWWRTGLFRTAGVLALVIALLALHRLRLSYLRREGQRLEEQVRARTGEIAEKNALLEKQARRLDEMARTDPLTGLGNRRDFLERAEEEMARARRRQRPFCIVLADLDRFKQVNDRHGHEGGDLVLVSVARTVLQAVREEDRVARWGGEELILLLPETDLAGGALLAERIRERVAGMTTVDPGGAALSVTLTLGVAEDGGRDNLDAIIADADAALYRGKAAGRNRVMRAHA